MRYSKQFHIILFALFGFILSSVVTVNAETIFYTNSNGVYLTKKEYDFYSEMFWDGYQDSVTLENYTYLKTNGYFNNEIEKKVVTNYSLLRGSSVTSNLRTLVISKSCSTNCFLVLNVSWIGTPFVHSYDVLGIRTSDVSVNQIGSAIVSGDEYSKSYSNAQSFSNGFGYSVLLPNVDNLKLIVSFETTTGGRIYGSYQHAKSNTTENVSKQYTLGVGGYGNVFNFIGNAINIYDNAPGVDIEV